MRVAVLTEPGEFAIEEREEPTADADEVLIEMREIGICGSDVHYYQHGRIGDNVVEDPLVLGHESAGEVVAAGDDVEDLKPGDRVAIEPGVPCRRCDHCKRGDYHLCPDVTFMGTPPIDGAFAEYVAWPADFAYELPENVSLREGALCEPLSVGVHACRRGDVGAGDTVCVTGAGPIGLVMLEVARAVGASDVVVADPVEAKRDLAIERGADLAVDPTETDLAAAVREHSGDGADVVIEASGAEPAIASTVDVARRGGTVVFVGMAADAEVPLDVLDVINEELDVHGSYRYANTYDAAIDMLADGDVDVEGFVDFESGIDDVRDAFERASDPETVKGMIVL